MIYPTTHNYGPPERGKHIVCFNCGELGHYRNDCPNLRKQMDILLFVGDVVSRDIFPHIV
jgi:hypothetical protein